MSVAVDSPTGNIASSTTNVVLTKANVKAVGEDVKISSIVVNCTDSTTSKTIKNLKVMWNGSQVGSAVATSAACDGAADNSFTLGSTVVARVGETNTLSINADITGTTSANETLSANFETGVANAQGLVSLNSINTSAVTGRTLTIAAGTLSVVKNSSFGDKAVGNPTGVVNATNIKIGSFTIIGGAGEDADVSQITLVDESTTYYASKYFQNIKLMHGTTQLGATVTSPATGSTTAQTHTFNVSPVVTIAAGSQYVVDVYADVKDQTQTVATDIVKFNSVTASGKLTGTSANYSTAKSLQNVYIAAAGSLTVSVNSDTALATNLLMGAVDQSLGKFDFVATASEPLNLTQLVISANVSSAATGTLKNVRLYDETGVMVGTAVAGFDTTSATTTYAHAVFSGLNFVVPAGVTKTLTVKADVTSYNDGGYTTTGQAVQVAILPHYTGTSSPITGTGAQSGVALSSSTITYTANGGSSPWTTVSGTNSTQVTAVAGQVRANEMVLYRAKLAIAWASDAPSGASSPSASQTVAKFVVTNQANAGAYVASVRYVNFGISTTISNSAGVSRILNVYKDSLSTSAIDTTTFTGGASIATNIGGTDFNIDGANWNVSVASGASRTFYVTLDTTDAASTKSLSINIPNQGTALGGATDTAKGFVWSDGVTTTIMASDNVLPLAYKTFTY
ncbi:MAG: hypothetical protein NTU97_02540 [Candidatus Magasanikbacteria bacterium]|nr:hypothetical protein [Candidatus Magasanikbacteria bacterium]